MMNSHAIIRIHMCSGSLICNEKLCHIDDPIFTVYNMDRIFVGLSWELHCRWQLDRAWARAIYGRQKHS